MCGICGIQPFSPRLKPPEGWVAGMCRRMAHRGPDEERLHVEPGVALGFARLAIVDLDGGHQPLASEDGAILALANGEIYNHRQLRRELEARGHRFRSRTDVEVIVHLYEEEGTGALRRLRGMFALALWDRRRRQLLLARDRLGIKPLYYTASPRLGFAFASEVRALLALPGVEVRPNLAALDDYLAYRFVPGGETFFEGIRILEPGRFLIVREGRVREGVYWRLPEASREAPPVEPADPACERVYAAELAAVLEESVGLHLQGDVPVGLLLSGGLDSATLLALAAPRSRQPLHTYSLGFTRQGEPLPGFWELEEARELARRFGTRHHEVVVETATLPERLPALVEALEEPLGDPTIFPLERISEEVHAHGRVVLSGEGADELFGGYAVYQAPFALPPLRRLPAPLRLRLAAWLERLPAGVPGRNWARRALLPVDAWYRCVGGAFDAVARRRLYAPVLRETLLRSGRSREAAGHLRLPDPVARMLELDLACMLPNDTLLKADKLTMAHSVELRVPFLDDAVVELAARIPSRLKVRRRALKHVLRQAMAGQLPADILQRRKLGFTAPVERLLRGELRPLVEDLLLDRRLAERGLFDPREVARLVRRVTRPVARSASRADSLAARQVFALLMLELWYRRFVDRGAAEGEREAEAPPRTGEGVPATAENA